MISAGRSAWQRHERIVAVRAVAAGDIRASSRWSVAETLGTLWPANVVEDPRRFFSWPDARRAAPGAFSSSAAAAAAAAAFFLLLGGDDAGLDDERRRWWPGRTTGGCGAAGVRVVRKRQLAGVVAKLWAERVTLPKAGENMARWWRRRVARRGVELSRGALVVMRLKDLLHVVAAPRSSSSSKPISAGHRSTTRDPTTSTTSHPPATQRLTRAHVTCSLGSRGSSRGNRAFWLRDAGLVAIEYIDS